MADKLKNNKLTEYILSHSKKRDEELKYDFMPSLLEIIERPSHKAGTVIIYGIFSLLLITIIWASFSKIDVVITTNGTIQPEGNISTLNAYTSGTIKSINIDEGSYVEKGDVLIELDTQSLDIDINSLNIQKAILEVQKEIFEKIIKGDDISKIKISDYDIQLHPYIQTIIDSDVSYHNNIITLENARANAELNNKIAVIQLEEYQSSGTARQQSAQQLVVEQSENEFRQSDIDLANAKSQYSASINDKLSETNTKLENTNANIAKYNLSISYQNITAPVSGYINSINVNNIGETVMASQQLITIVPADAELEMVCYVKNMDIADISTNMEAEIKLEAYPYNKYGTVKGKVKYISPSSFMNEKIGSVYLVKLSIDNSNENIDIISGLSGSAEIKIGKRTIMSYFLDPITKGFGESLKEK